jgi:hypothetical protein
MAVQFERTDFFKEPACPECYEPFETEAPEDEFDEVDRRPVLLLSGSTVCSCCASRLAKVGSMCSCAPAWSTGAVRLRWLDDIICVDYDIVLRTDMIKAGASCAAVFQIGYAWL